MKKLLLLLVPVIFLMVACNNKPANTETTVSTSDSTMPAVNDTTPGGGLIEAQVWEDKTGTSLAGATVSATQNGNVVETVTTNEKGTYNFNKLYADKSYVITAHKDGYKDSTLTLVYKDSASNPRFPLKKN